MKFGRSGSVPLSQVGTEHLSWKSKITLEQRSGLVSIERSLKQGLVKADRVIDMLQTRDWVVVESLGKKREELRKGGQGSTEEDREEPFERFPRMFDNSPVRGFRRGYDAPWAQSQFELRHYLLPTNNKAPKLLLKERTRHTGLLREAAASQQARITRLYKERFPRFLSETVIEESPVRKSNMSMSYPKKERGVRFRRVGKEVARGRF